jgi:hypothetical protein
LKGIGKQRKLVENYFYVYPNRAAVGPVAQPAPVAQPTPAVAPSRPPSGPNNPGPNPGSNPGSAQPDPNTPEKPTPADARNWQPLPTEGEGFRIVLPNTPRLVNTILPKIKADGNEYRSTGGEFGGKKTEREVYQCGYAFVPQNATSADKKRLRDDLTNALASQGYAADGAMTRREVTVGGRTWQEVQWSRANHPLGAKGGTVLRLFETPDYLFYMMATRSDGLPPADVQKRFFESFELLK